MTRGGILLGGVAATAIVAVMSLLPPEAKFALHTHGILHPWLHLAAFAVVASLLILGAPSPKLRLLLLFGTILFGIGTEYAEHFLNNTPIESSDIFADTVGASLGFLTSLFLSEE